MRIRSAGEYQLLGGTGAWAGTSGHGTDTGVRVGDSGGGVATGFLVGWPEGPARPPGRPSPAKGPR